jgi:hypothetical protein
MNPVDRLHKTIQMFVQLVYFVPEDLRGVKDRVSSVYNFVVDTNAHESRICDESIHLGRKKAYQIFCAWMNSLSEERKNFFFA